MKRKMGKAIIIVSLLFAVGCQKDDTYEKSIESGKLAIVDGDYEKAKGFFNMALESNKEDEEADALYRQTVKVIKVKELKEEGNFEDAKNLLAEIGKIKSESSAVKEEVINLEKEIDKELQNKVNMEVVPIKNKNQEDTIKTSNKFEVKKQLYKDKLSKLEGEATKVHEGYGIGELSTSDYVNGIYDIYIKYDNILNDMYQDLKETLSNSEMSELKSVQVSWIKEKESAKQNIEKNESGMHANWVAITVNDMMSEMTKERCYELLNYFN